MIITIADCNHGFYTQEIEECNNLSVKLGINIELETPICNQDSLVSQCSESNIIIVQRLQIDGEIIDQMPHCRVVTRYGVGLDNVDCEAMKLRNIKVVNFPSFCTQEVATHTLSLILFLHRRLDVISSNKNSLADYWGKPSLLEDVRSNSNTTIGVVGIGKIGGCVVTYLSNMGFNVIAYDPHVDSQRYIDLRIAKVTKLESLFDRSDIVTIHAPLTEETRGMINNSLFSGNKMLVNTSRGEIVNRADLVDALQNKRLRAAYIDVCDPEPPDESLLKIPNLHITPHCAFYSVDSLDGLKRGVIRKSLEAYGAM